MVSDEGLKVVKYPEGRGAIHLCQHFANKEFSLRVYLDNIKFDTVTRSRLQYS